MLASLTQREGGLSFERGEECKLSAELDGEGQARFPAEGGRQKVVRVHGRCKI